MGSIQECSCAHEFQDKLHGKGNRVHNSVGKGKEHGKEVVCTVCLAKKPNKHRKDTSKSK